METKFINMKQIRNAINECKLFAIFILICILYRQHFGSKHVKGRHMRRLRIGVSGCLYAFHKRSEIS